LNLYEACAVLDFWHVAKARAEVWRLVKSIEITSLDDVKALAKIRFKELAMEYHPDHGGDHDHYLKIQEAHNTIDRATIHDFIFALDFERQLQTVYYKPGSRDCGSCKKWSNVVSACMTTRCTGYDNALQRNDKVGREGKNLSSSSFFETRSERLGQSAA